MTSERRFPVIEVFGPTIQGEGSLAGVTTYFVRFGGCDYLCSWCDSLYAVIPAQVRANAVKLTAEEIIDRLGALNPLPSPAVGNWVTLSGGNPALLPLDGLVHRLHEENYRVAVETQGSRWNDWLALVDCLTVSPKPPSSGMATFEHGGETFTFLNQAANEDAPVSLKIVVFDDDDFDWATEFFQGWPDGWSRFLSVGTDPPADDEPRSVTIGRVCDRYRWLCERVAHRAALADVRVLPQLHVLSWGHARAV